MGHNKPHAYVHLEYDDGRGAGPSAAPPTSLFSVELKRPKLSAALMCTGVLVGSIILLVLPLVWLYERTTANPDLPQLVTVNAALRHLAELQARVNNSELQNSRSLRLGFNTSRDYILEVLALDAPELIVTQQHFPVDTFEVVGAPLFATASSADEQGTYAYTTDYTVAQYSNAGALTQASLAVSLDDYCASSGVAAGADVLLVTRGNCTFYQKAMNAAAAGYKALLVINNVPGNAPAGTLSQTVPIVVLLLSQTAGERVLQYAPGGTVSLSVATAVRTIGTTNVCAERDDGDDNSVVIAGAHLDSVDAGPGMNDNGSGAAANLVLAVEYARAEFAPYNRMRFCWWAAEEAGLKGSRYYVAQALADHNADKIVAYINFDMIASPNYRRGLYDASTAALPAPGSTVIAASIALQEMFLAHYELHEEAVVLVPMTGRSDYQPFFDAGIAVAGLETGAEGIKSVTERDIFGGSANVAYDSCYHQACDTLGNINTDVYATNLQALAHVIQEIGRTADLRMTLHGAASEQ